MSDYPYEGLDVANLGDFGYNKAIRKATRSEHVNGPYIDGHGDLMWVMHWSRLGHFINDTRYVFGHVDVVMVDDYWVEVRFDARN